MATVIGPSSYVLGVVGPKAAPFGGGGGPNISEIVQVTTGTSANQANLMGGLQFTVGASSNTDKDLLTDFLDPDGNALSGLVEICELTILVAGNSAGVVNVSPGASNGFTGLIDGGTDNVVLKDGSRLVLRNYTATGVAAVSGTNKVINFANADASNTVTITAWVVGRNA